jgi:hypothetical protein
MYAGVCVEVYASIEEEDTCMSADRGGGYMHVCRIVCINVCVPPTHTQSLTRMLSPVSKETYYSVKRDLLQRQKRPITASKETY